MEFLMATPVFFILFLMFRHGAEWIRTEQTVIVVNRSLAWNAARNGICLPVSTADLRRTEVTILPLLDCRSDPLAFEAGQGAASSFWRALEEAGGDLQGGPIVRDARQVRPPGYVTTTSWGRYAPDDAVQSFSTLAKDTYRVGSAEVFSGTDGALAQGYDRALRDGFGQDMLARRLLDLFPNVFPAAGR